MTSTRPGRNAHLRHVAADAERVRGTLQQPVYRWEMQWTYPESDKRQHLRVRRWVKTEQLAEIEPDRDETPAQMTPRDPHQSSANTPVNINLLPAGSATPSSSAPTTPMPPGIHTMEVDSPATPIVAAADAVADAVEEDELMATPVDMTPTIEDSNDAAPSPMNDAGSNGVDMAHTASIVSLPPPPPPSAAQPPLNHDNNDPTSSMPPH
ncbi:hypothetical protein SYNPS1DRAFT_29242 [Syncephalis pseudoplumigaleata]|uniref:Uncharacterized protein n=1 Tax=Syncephalis pseudoplumigaleata TaxID=1712513 RepID=A0A4P9Z008_9FUNG|nr:hypothetical protein SYNPS1DRAFT_29242 [Syncephalis pseudoplumigaleata]|eukprot:RKP25011.1 hypothetical protein SYNPS1DRAFT_29242 [Syncephalis pseudoplumigaleata]